MKRSSKSAGTTCIPVIAMAGIVAGGCLLPDARARAADFTGNIATLTTDYVWRGTTQTRGNPAAQAGLKVSGDSGFYLSAWGSNVKFAPGSDAASELDFVAGWSQGLGPDWSLDVNVLRYHYPGTAQDLDWTELNGTLAFRDHYWASVGWSDQALGYDAHGVYTLLGARFPLSRYFRLEATLGHYFLDDTVLARSGYTHGSLSTVWAFDAPFELRLTAHATDARAKTLFGNAAADHRIEAALQASF